MTKIPKFKSDKDLAKFWDTHSLADFEEDLAPAKGVIFVKPERQIVSLRLDRKVVNTIKTLAAKKGIGYSSLVRMWLLENVRQELAH